MAVHSWDSHSRAHRFRREAGKEELLKQLGKACGHFLPLVAFIEEPHMDSIPSPSSTPEIMCPGKCKHHLCAFNSPVLSQLQPVSTPALFNHHWHTCLVIWLSPDSNNPIATTPYGCCAAPLCHLAWPWWLVNLPN